MAKLEEQQVSIEAEVQEMCTDKSINFERLLEKMDEAALLERRQAQYGKVLGELFPGKKEVAE